MAYKQIRRRTRSELGQTEGATPEVSHAPEVSQIQTDRDLMTADDAFALQDVVGNRATGQLIGAATPPAPPRIGYIQPKPIPPQPLRPGSSPHAPAYAHLRRKPTLQRASWDGSFDTNANFESQVNQQNGGGKPLPSDVRADLEPKFGADFSGVKIHADAKAAQLSQDVGAQAFTHGSNIYFNQGKYNPASSSGKHLLAHELTHTVQQGGSGVQPMRNKSVVSNVAQKPSLQRYTILDPQQVAVTARTNKQNLDMEKGTFNYEIGTQEGAALKVSNDGNMAVPNVNQTKDFYAADTVINQSNQVLAGQNSIVTLANGGSNVSVPNPTKLNEQKSLKMVKPVLADEVNKEINGITLIGDVCITIAHQIATGGKWGNTSKAKVKSTNAPVSISNQSAREFDVNYADTVKNSEQLGINEHAIPEIGEMLATYSMGDTTQGEWQYHYAAVAAKSGADYVTLENYNRDDEIKQSINAIWDKVATTDELINQYNDYIEIYTQGEDLNTFSEIVKQEYIQKARLKLIEELQKDKIESEKISNAVIQKGAESSLLHTLWYFDMFGPKAQSFHTKQTGSGDFSKPVTFVMSSSAGRDDTGGIDPRVLNIDDPLQDSRGKREKFKGKFGKSEQQKTEAALKKQARGLKTEVNMETLRNKLETLEHSLGSLGDGRTADKTRYTAQVLRLRLAIHSKTIEIEQKIPQLGDMPLEKVSKLIKSYHREIEFYRNKYNSVKNHAEYKSQFGKNFTLVMNHVVDQMDEAITAVRGLHNKMAINQLPRGRQRVDPN